MGKFNWIKDKWTKNDMYSYRNYISTLINNNKSCEWEQNIINTKLKCFGRTASKAKKFYKEIKKGNFLSFLRQLEIQNHFDSMLCAYLINFIDDWSIYKKYLNKYILTIDNWASCDALKFNKHTRDKLYLLSCNLLKSKNEFIKRIAINIYFELIKEPTYLDKVFNTLDSLKNETQYYVNMAASWLLCECFVKYHDETLQYFKNNKTNNFIINKAISKCRDSFRISKKDKDMLLKLRITYKRTTEIK